MMGSIRFPWSLTGALLATSYLQALCVSATPSVNVALKTAFSSAPFLLELLETAGDENATSYLPLLDRIADGYFSKATTDKELYEQFVTVLKVDGHVKDAEALSSYQLALSLRTTAPRIEAHYQYYHTAVEPSLVAEQKDCVQWILQDHKQYCDPLVGSPYTDIEAEGQDDELPFDRVLGNPTAPVIVLYADVTAPSFGEYHKSLAKEVKEGRKSYRLRHKPNGHEQKPLYVNGYGVELALKRTDYIVIDDREAEESQEKTPQKTDTKLEDQELADLKPLSTSEVLHLGLKAGSFVMQSENPFDTLLKLSQDFPKYSSAIAASNLSNEFLAEHQYNRNIFWAPGRNILWINGVQIIERLIDPYSLLDLLRNERKFIRSFADFGLSVQEGIKLLSHPAVEDVKANIDPTRFDWRDDIEEGKPLVWLNDLEKDKRYSDWPSSINALMQRTYPGNMPSVARDVMNIVFPVDLSDLGDVLMIAQQLEQFVKRKIAVRIGLVPTTKSKSAEKQAKVFYHLVETYGLSAGLEYLRNWVMAKTVQSPNPTIFETTIKDRKVRPNQTPQSLDEILASETYQNYVNFSKKWVSRLAADSPITPFFVNGVPFPRDENWIQSMTSRLMVDLQLIQRGIYTEAFDADSYLPSAFLDDAMSRRNSLITPDDESTIRVFDMSKLDSQFPGLLNRLPSIKADISFPKENWAHLIVIADLETEAGQELVSTALTLREVAPSVELLILHNPSDSENGALAAALYSKLGQRSFGAFDTSASLSSYITDSRAHKIDHDENSSEHFRDTKALIKSLDLAAGQNALLLNGRLVGPVPTSSTLGLEDLTQLLAVEGDARIGFVFSALEELGLSDKIVDPLSSAKMTSMVALSTVSDVPEGIFEQASTLRTSLFTNWNSDHTAIHIGDQSTASIQITAVVDPVSEQSQRWLPILKVLSELDGVALTLFLNPRERLQELPVKRFYRYVLDSTPAFEEDGSLKDHGAKFSAVPQEALLTVGMDVPPSWLVASNESIHDLDNLKLSSIKADVTAIYQLEHILIEGHSREVPGSSPPRGAQLVLQTESDPHYADTIIMANVGYFQFKANPGFYKISLQEGRSSDIFEIDSLGTDGWAPVAGDQSTHICLMSFQGTTLYPRLSRKHGMEKEDVLEAKTDSMVSRGFKFAESLLGSKDVLKKENAEINIFSVASGHLYERMLNIMMVSVMKNTKHTVKFWFIEQFLSPSFKDFIPHLAAEYGFEYEMVTYKWPHWLRGQSEKQREIWGYKILFLDVLFPLSLDKVIFVDADQIVRTDMIELVNHDLKGAPYGFTPMCDSRTEMEGFRFWKQGYWKNFLGDLPYHISALYVVDLRRFRQIAAGDRLRQNYHQLSADPNSLSNLDQDLPNHMQSVLPIHSLPQDWLWCETWCSDEAFKTAKTIDLCNNPQTKEPKLDRARRQVPEWTLYDDEIAALDRRRRGVSTDKGETAEKLEEEEGHKKDEL